MSFFVGDALRARTHSEKTFSEWGSYTASGGILRRAEILAHRAKGKLKIGEFFILSLLGTAQISPLSYTDKGANIALSKGG